eukprot:CAMPEP_0184008468 /NCGR_PEP_ID=MMETSP0954-20121128/1994_1 /TAXON_ID=627963 /ORGANISM="Aplanochytrium sp, Strain PBS07" /LENGTH=467 /DNA_ID=CAMNT_0026287589 /DNA_START=146 /DNA_END=1549 /DNA_ORIENTATION=+
MNNQTSSFSSESKEMSPTRSFLETPVYKNRNGKVTPDATKRTGNNSNPQDRTPTPSKRNSNQDHPQTSDLVGIQQSLDRLRTQRLILERLKGESEKKTVKISSLTAKISELEELTKSQQSKLDYYTGIFGDLEVAKTKISHLEEIVSNQKEELHEKSKRSEAMQGVLKSSLNQEKLKHEQEKQQFEKEKIYLQNRFNAERSEKLNLELKVNTQAEELKAIRPQLEAEKIKYEKACQNFAEKVNARDIKVNALESERKQLLNKMQSVGRRNQELKSELENTTKTLAGAREKEVILTKAIVELEENNNLLRIQLLDLEKNMSGKIETLEVKLKETVSELDERSLLCEKQEKETRKLQNELLQSKTMQEDLKATVERKNIELNNMQDLLSRSKAHSRACEEQVQRAVAKVSEQHSRMLVEMSKSAKLKQQLEYERNSNREWTKTRLDLLNQFCEEEARFDDTFSTMYIDN